MISIWNANIKTQLVSTNVLSFFQCEIHNNKITSHTAYYNVNAVDYNIVNTYHAGHWFYWAIFCLFSQNSNISQFISGITKPIPGMLVLNWMHFSWWIQIWSWNSTILYLLRNWIHFWPVVCTRLPRGKYYYWWLTCSNTCTMCKCKSFVNGNHMDYFSCKRKLQK